MQFRQGALVVFEGMDATGKTTQRELLRSLPWTAAPQFVHMPSGLTEASAKAYERALGGQGRRPWLGLRESAGGRTRGSR